MASHKLTFGWLGAYMRHVLLVLFIQKNQGVGAYTKVSQDFTICTIE